MSKLFLHRGSRPRDPLKPSSLIGPLEAMPLPPAWWKVWKLAKYARALHARYKVILELAYATMLHAKRYDPDGMVIITNDEIARATNLAKSYKISITPTYNGINISFEP
jgi:hypothetical protein